MSTTVWVKEAGAIRPARVELGTSDGDNVEVKSGLSEGDEVVLKMTVASAKEKKEKEVASNPFMPTPPGRRSTQSTSRTGTNAAPKN